MIPMRERIPVCPHSIREDIKKELVFALEKLERGSGLTLKFGSGLRCEECNTSVGGVKNSAHLRGLAVDIAVGGSVLRFKILLQAISQGFCRIGIGRGFVHLDLDINLPQRVAWLY